MCGRYALFASGDEIAKRFRLAEAPQLDARNNIAPTQTVAAVRATDAGRELARLRWSLISSWATDPTMAYKLINARAETVESKPSFRSAFKQRRCLILASAFYDWQQGKGKSKQPYCMRPRDGELFSIAGVWESWHDPEGEEVESCTILTTTANELMRTIHDRMPVILDTEAEWVWLDPHAPVEDLRSLLVPFASDRMEAYPVDPYVSNAKNQGPKCIEPLDAA
jgi:putative SOS response-associated peptidase YedK